VKPLDSFVSASTSAWQFSHHGSAARALIVPGHAAHARVSRPVGEDQFVPQALVVMMMTSERSVVVVGPAEPRIGISRDALPC
jgi:hypothetical protein